MTSAKNEDVTDAMLGIAPGTHLDGLRRQRMDVRVHTLRSYEAILSPRDPGGLGLSERAALAARIARHNGDHHLARHYDTMLAERGGDPALTDIAQGSGSPSGPFSAMVVHVDRVALTPRISTEAHIKILTTAGLSTPDIVRLTELIAFVSYQVRVLAGLRLLKAGV